MSGTVGDLIPFGPGAWTFIGLYLLSTIGIGYLAYRARAADTLGDFYLAGRGFGLVVLAMTLFATQYSGNTFFGFTGKVYRVGFAWIVSLHFMLAIVLCYLTFAPRLQRLARAREYITPADFLRDRFDSRVLASLGALVMIVAAGNFLLAQLVAMGRAMQGLTGDANPLAYPLGVVGLATIMVIYGTLGGMRAVAWTDAIQGAVMVVGFAVLLFLVLESFGPVGAATRAILEAPDPALRTKATPPGLRACIEWLSYVAIVGLGAALYPQAIQRIYAARSPKILRRSLMAMAILPIPTQLIALVVGVMALAYLPGLEGAASDQVLGRVMATVQAASALGAALVVLLMAAILAAMMSTADSALLAISSMLTRDIYGRWLRPDAPEAALTRFGKRCSWVAVTLLVGLAILLEDRSSLVALLDRKFDILVQLAPAFLLGVRWPGLRSDAALAGMVVGLAVALTLAYGGFDFVRGGKVYGIHPGLIGLACNLLVAMGGSLNLGRRARDVRENGWPGTPGVG